MKTSRAAAVKRCEACRRVLEDGATVCPADGVPVGLDSSTSHLFADPRGTYERGHPGNIDWMHQTVEGLARVLALRPDHRPAAALKRELESELVDASRRADDVFRAGDRFINDGDLASCLRLLEDHRWRFRQRQATELRRRIKEEIREGIEPAPATEENRDLAQRIFDLTQDWIMEMPLTVGAFDGALAGIQEVLFLWPDHAAAIAERKSLEQHVRDLEDQSAKVAERALERLAADDLVGCLRIVEQHGGWGMGSRHARDVLQRVEERLASAPRAEASHPGIQALLDEVRRDRHSALTTVIARIKARLPA